MWRLFLINIYLPDKFSKMALFLHKSATTIVELFRTADIYNSRYSKYQIFKTQKKHLTTNAIKCFFEYNAGNGNRTRTGVTTRRILSPVRLPVPPHRHVSEHLYYHNLRMNICQDIFLFQKLIYEPFMIMS